MSNLEPPRRERSEHSHRRHHDHDRGRRYHSRSKMTDSRSRSPGRKDGTTSRHHTRSRREHENPSKHYSRISEPEPLTLPFGAVLLSKRDLARYEPLFAMYLDIQKNIDIADLDERELKGRWKSFVGKWNRAELAEGWYDSSTLDKAIKAEHERDPSEGPDTTSRAGRRASPSYGSDENRPMRRDDTQHSNDGQGQEPGQEMTEAEDDIMGEDEDEDEEAYGPQAPSSAVVNSKAASHRSGPKIPTMEDLEFQRDNEQSSYQEARSAQRFSRKQDIKSHKKELRVLEDEVAPKAEPGTHERRLEKRQERAASNRAFADSRRGASPTEAVGDSELMGGGEGGDDLESLKQVREKETRKKNDRELRKEEILRARAAEREVRLRAYRRKEDETMDYLRAIAKERFG